MMKIIKKEFLNDFEEDTLSMTEECAMQVIFFFLI